MGLNVALSKKIVGNRTKIDRDKLLSLLRGRGMMAPSIFDQPHKMRNLLHFWCSTPHIMGISWKLWVKRVQIYFLFTNVVSIGEEMEEVTIWLQIIPTLAIWWFMPHSGPSIDATPQINDQFWRSIYTISAAERWDPENQYLLKYWMVYSGDQIG